MASYATPACYNTRPPQMSPQIIKLLTFNTLFYIFYNFPHDKKQSMAREELEVRGWTFVKESNEWHH